MPAYTVELTLGAIGLTLIEGAPTDLNGTVFALDGAQLSWRWETDEWPSQLEPLQATVRVAVLDVANLGALDFGSGGSVRCLDSTGFCFAAVYGRVSEITAEQVRRAHPVTQAPVIWTIVTCTITDPSATSNVPAALDRPAESADSRLAAVTADTGVTFRSVPALAMTAATVSEGAVDYYKRVVSSAVTAVPDTFLLAGSVPAAQVSGYVVAPIADPVTGALALLSAHVVDFTRGLPPAQLVVAGGQLQLAPRAGVPNAIPGNRVQLAGGWRRTADTNTTHVRFERPDGAPPLKMTSPTWSPGQPVVRQDVDARDFASGGAILGAMGSLRFQGDVIPGWDRDTFVYAPSAPDDLKDAWFPDLSSARWSTSPTPAGGVPTGSEPASPCLVNPVAIFGVPDAANLAGKAGVVTGVLRSVDITIASGDVVVTFALRRILYRLRNASFTVPLTPQGLSYAELRTLPPAAYRGAAPLVDPGLIIAELRILDA